MAKAMGVKYAFVAEFLGDHRARTLAYWHRDELFRNFEWDLRGTPCEDVVYGSLCHHPVSTKEKFPEDRALVELGIESYLGVPLRGPDGETLGHLAVFNDLPMPKEPRLLYMFSIFASRATGELLRLRAEKRLRESEERYRDLFEEAPVAYVHEDLDTRFISANRAAIRILGLKPDEVVGTIGKSLVPDTPEAQRRLGEALKCFGRGTDTAG
jgi:PAS domain-containing protein